MRIEALVYREITEWVSVMPDELSDLDNRAIREEIGERLRYILPVDHSELPPCIEKPLSRLRELDAERAPSIVPSLEDALVD